MRIPKPDSSGWIEQVRNLVAIHVARHHNPSVLHPWRFTCDLIKNLKRNRKKTHPCLHICQQARFFYSKFTNRMYSHQHTGQRMKKNSCLFVGGSERCRGIIGAAGGCGVGALCGIGDGALCRVWGPFVANEYMTAIGKTACPVLQVPIVSRLLHYCRGNDVVRTGYRSSNNLCSVMRIASGKLVQHPVPPVPTAATGGNKTLRSVLWWAQTQLL